MTPPAETWEPPGREGGGALPGHAPEGMTVDAVAEALAAAQRAGHGSDRVVVRGYEAGLDDVVRVLDVDVVPDARTETHYGPHDLALPLGHPDRPASGPRERVVWFVGSRDLDGDRVYPEGSGW